MLPCWSSACQPTASEIRALQSPILSFNTPVEVTTGEVKASCCDSFAEAFLQQETRPCNGSGSRICLDACTDSLKEGHLGQTMSDRLPLGIPEGPEQPREKLSALSL